MNYKLMHSTWPVDASVAAAERELRLRRRGARQSMLLRLARRLVGRR